MQTKTIGRSERITPPQQPKPRREAGVAGLDFARDVRAGLSSTPRRLPCRYFYDREGSLLFERICDLPEYYLSRAERAILAAHAPAIAAACAPDTAICELGSGSASKTRLLFDAFLARQNALTYRPIDVSRSMLEESSAALLGDYPALRVAPIAAEYQAGLAELARVRGSGPQLLLWLGSNIGNLPRPEAIAFAAQLAESLRPQDRLLVGIDLRKSHAVLEPAYDDAQGVTAAFNLNVLARINRELGGNFELGAFRHRARYDEDAGKIEMHLVSQRAQRVRIAALELELNFAAGEAIHTEDSYKYSLAEIRGLAAAAGLRVEAQWFDEGLRFSETLFARQP